MLVTDPPVRSAARSLFGPGAPVNAETIIRFEQAYNCSIERVKHNQAFTPGIPRVIFNTEQDEMIFILRWA